MASAGQKKRAKKSQSLKGWKAKVARMDAADLERERYYAARNPTYTDCRVNPDNASDGWLSPSRKRKPPKPSKADLEVFALDRRGVPWPVGCARLEVIR
jgi:hypothetical protein